jgi:hypothetical protein
MSDVLMFDGARERTVGQYRHLLDGTGWRLEQVVAIPEPMSVIQAPVRRPVNSSWLIGCRWRSLTVEGNPRPPTQWRLQPRRVGRRIKWRRSRGGHRSHAG